MPHRSNRDSGKRYGRDRSSSSDSDRGKRKKGRKRKHSSSRSREERRQRPCGSATLSFDVTEFSPALCTKQYLFVDSAAISSTAGGVTIANAATNASSIEATVPISARWLVVTWDFKIGVSGALVDEPDMTRYIITVDRADGSCFSPLVKFQVPVARTPVNDCGVLSETSLLAGVSQSFPVKCCPGDELCVGISESIAPLCLTGQCGGGPSPAVNQQIIASTLAFAIVKLYLF